MKDPKVKELHTKLRELRDEFEDHAQKTDNPQCEALCETTAEVLAGLEESFDEYLESGE